MKDTKSLLLALLSLGLVGTWIYHLYDKTIYSKEISSTESKTPPRASDQNDSLKHIYSTVVQKLDSGIHFASSIVDSLDNSTDLNKKIVVISNLKNEINTVLTDPNATAAEIDIARQKIITLRQKTEELRNDKAVMEEEKKQMLAMLEKMTSEIDNEQKDTKKLEEENKEITEKITKVSTFTASKLRLIAMSSNGSSEKETSESKKTEKFALSFVVQNKAVQYNNAEVYVVVIKPNGQVLQSEQVWESGSFTSSNGSKKNYTLKMRFEYNKGQSKPLSLTLNAENYQKGNYKMQLYHNGALIGQTTKKLS